MKLNRALEYITLVVRDCRRMSCFSDNIITLYKVKVSVPSGCY